MHNYAVAWKKWVNFLQLPYDEFVEKSIPSSSYYLAKVDGLLGAMIYRKKDPLIFQTTGGLILSDLPVLEEYKNILDRVGDIDTIVVMGELVAMKDGKVLPFNVSSGLVRRWKEESSKHIIHHFAYDIFRLNGNKITDFKYTHNLLYKMFENREYIHFPEFRTGDINTFRKLFLKVINKVGFEGVVVRNTGGRNYKVKKTDTFDLCIIGAGEIGMPAWQKDQISYLMTSFVDESGYFRTSSNVGTGFDFKTRSEFFEYINKNNIYQDKKGRMFVPPKLVIEVSWQDYNLTNTPFYKFEKGKYVYQGKKISVTMRFPSFVRMRPDKSVNSMDLRLSQVPEFSV